MGPVEQSLLGSKELEDLDIGLSLSISKIYHLSQLLPYDPSVKTGLRLRDGLREFHLLIVLAQGALESLQKGTLKDFDPLVGENACQIRAIKIALIAQNNSIDLRRLHDELAYSKYRIEQLLLSTPNFANIT
jgi:hypothetical protein